MSKSILIAGNWKMNKTWLETQEFIQTIRQNKIVNETKAHVAICMPFPYLLSAKNSLLESPIKIGAQNVSNKEKGAYTGEVSAAQLKSIAIDYVIIGHSERRSYNGETDEIVNEKIKITLQNQLSPIFCIGETLQEREEKREFDVVKTQIEQGLSGIKPEEFSKIVIAYEPVWAIGTGKTATSAQAQEMHQFIRSLIKVLYNQELANKTLILYGGSMNAANAKELLAQPDINGGLIGGASLQVADFVSIIEQAGE